MMSLAHQIAEQLQRSKVGLRPLHIAERLGADLFQVRREIDVLIAAQAAAVRPYSQRVILLTDDIDGAVRRKQAQPPPASKADLAERIYEALRRPTQRKELALKFSTICRYVEEDSRSKTSCQRVHLALNLLLEMRRIEHIDRDKWRAL